jgi:hypothetical protein
MMADQNEQYAYSTIAGGFDPAEITARVGVTPTDCRRQGDPHPRTQQPNKFSRWSLYSRLGRDRELEAHVRDVLDQLEGNRAGFQHVSREYGGCMQLVGYFRAGYPGLGFDRDVIEKLATYALSVDFDFYGLDPNSAIERSPTIRRSGDPDSAP